MKHLSLVEHTTMIIKEKILNLHIEPGSRIREDLLAEELSISRTPVREAIKQLVAEGFVINVPRKGLFCIELTTKRLRELLDVREALEILAIQKCIDKIDMNEMVNLEKIFNEYEAAMLAGNYSESNLLDGKLHVEIVNITANEKLKEFIMVIEDFMLLARNMNVKGRTMEIDKVSLQDHKMILEAIRKRDEKLAQEAVSNNIVNMKKNLHI